MKSRSGGTADANPELARVTRQLAREAAALGWHTPSHVRVSQVERMGRPTGGFGLLASLAEGFGLPLRPAVPLD